MPTKPTGKLDSTSSFFSNLPAAAMALMELVHSAMTVSWCLVSGTIQDV